MERKEDLPKILIITEALPNVNGKGISQTLFNLFKDYPAEKIVLCKPDYDKQDDKIQAPFNNKVIEFKFSKFKNINKFPFRYFKSFINKITYFLWKNEEDLLSEKIKKEQIELILLLPMTYDAVWVTYKVYQKLNTQLVVYLMDDWVPSISDTFIQKKTNEYLKFLLTNSKGWLMISKYLTEELALKYGIPIPPNLVVHNPVDEKIITSTLKKSQGNPIKVIYAGSIWPMHLDSFEITAEAIYGMKGKYNIELIVYTDISFYNYYKSLFEKYDIKYGGNKPYSEIHEYLREGDILLVCSSFDKSYESFSRSSVQTKITDYLASGNAVLSVGPPYSACNKFIKENNIGFACEEKDLKVCQKNLELILLNKEEVINKRENGLELLRTKLNAKVVNKKLYSFLGKLKN